MRTIMAKKASIALLLIGVVGGIAGAQVVLNLLKTRVLSSGLFTVFEGDRVSAHMTVLGPPAGGPSVVIVRFINPAGVTVEQAQVSLLPGLSATVNPTKLVPGQRYRAQFELYDPTASPRVLVPSIEIVNLLTGATRYPPVEPVEPASTGWQ